MRNSKSPSLTDSEACLQSRKQVHEYVFATPLMSHKNVRFSAYLLHSENIDRS